MKITIDEKVCKKHKLSIEEFLYALTIRQVVDLDTVLKSLLDKEVLIYNNDRKEYLVTQPWSDKMDEIICSSSGKVLEVEDYYPLALKMMEIYPQGKVPGTPYYYKCNKAEIAKKLQKFFLQYGQYTDDDVLEATKRYVESFNGNYQFLKLLKYFIAKNEQEVDENGEVHMVEHSYLADYLENKDSGEGEVGGTNTSDWMMSVKN